MRTCCPVCLNAHCEPGAATCPDCGIAHIAARGGPVPPPRPAVDDAQITRALQLLQAHDRALYAADAAEGLPS
jgi:hypothetical protein